MSRSDSHVAALLSNMNLAFNNSKEPPAGGLVEAQVRPGDLIPALDNFDECALAWVLAGSRFPTTSFPTIDTVADCRARQVFEYSIGIARCSQALDDNGYLPSLETMEAEFAVQEDDKDRLDAVVCRTIRQLKREYSGINFARGAIETYGPQGGTVAVHTSLSIELP